MEVLKLRVCLLSLCRCCRRLGSCSLHEQMVYDFVEEKQGLDLLRDKRVIAATADIAGIAMSKSEVGQTPIPISKMELHLGRRIVTINT